MNGLSAIAVDLAAIRHNARVLAEVVAPAKLTVVLKANAYGHGLVPVARAVAPLVERIGIYTVEEAEALRAAGITTSLHILGPIAPGDLARAHATRSAITLWDDGTYRADVVRVAEAARQAFSVHAKIDTGVVRLGMRPEDAPARIASYLADPSLAVRGAFSHLAAVEELDYGFTADQCARFDLATDALAPALHARGAQRHIAASAAALLYPQTRYDAVRCGIALYGIYPSLLSGEILRERGVALRPALSWQTTIVNERHITAGTTVGYGRTWTADRDTRIAVLPIGYAEGIPRAASSRAFVLVDGERCPIVGRVCMDMTMVDVTKISQKKAVGLTVCLLGDQGNERLGADDWGVWCDTISYEIVTRLPEHITRSYGDSDNLVWDQHEERIGRA